MDVYFQEIKSSGAPGYKYISVEEDEAANVLYCNGTLLHLSSEQIPKGFAVSIPAHRNRCSIIFQYKFNSFSSLFRRNIDSSLLTL